MSEAIEAVQRFSACMKQTEERLTKTLELVTAGRVPEKHRIDDIVSHLKSLGELHADLKQLALEVSDVSIEDTDNSAFAYIEAIERAEEEKTAAFKARLDSLIEILESFLRIKALGDDYEAALLPFQKEAGEVLQHIRALEDCNLPKELEEACEPKRLFLEAVRIEDFGTHEGETLLNEIGPLYPWKVQQGLMLRKYFVEDASSDVNGILNDGQAVPVQSDKDPEVEPECSKDELGAVVPIPNDGMQPADEDDLDQGVVPDAEAGEASDALLTPVERVRISKKASAASFKRELLQSVPESVRIVVPAVRVCSCIEENQIGLLAGYMSGEYSRAEIDECVSYLVRKGILSRFEMGDGASVYCISNYGRNLLDKESIRQLKLRQKSFWLFSIDGGSNSYDDGLSEQFAKMRLKQVDRLIGCYALTMSEPSSDEGRIGPIVGISFEDDVLKIRASLDGSIEEFVVIGEDEDEPEDATHVLRVTLSDEVPASTTGVVKDDTPSHPVETGHAVDLAKVSGEGGEPLGGSFGSDETADDAYHDDAGQMVMGADDAGNLREQAIPTVGDEISLSEGIRASLDEGEGASSDLPFGQADTTVEEEPEYTPKMTIHDHVDALEEPTSPLPEVTVSPDPKRPALAIEGLLDTGSVLNASCPRDDDFMRIASHMLNHPDESVGSYENGAVASALALLESAASIDGYQASSNKLMQLRLATGTRAKGVEYTGSVLAHAFVGFNADDEPLMLSAYSRALFDPKNPYDYELWSTCEVLLSQYGETFPSYPELRTLLSKLFEIHDVSPTRGFSERVIDLLGDRADRSKRLESMRDRARRLMEKPTFKAMIHGMPEFNEACFGRNSDLYLCMATIQDDMRDEIDIVRDTLSRYQDGSGQIDEDLIGGTLDTNWRAAVANKNTKGIRKLEVLARKQAIDAFTARLALMGDWITYVEGSVDDKSTKKLGEIRKELIVLLSDCANSLSQLGQGRPGLIIVRLMLDDLLSRLSGNGPERHVFDEFLLSGYVSLKDDGTPDIDPGHNSIRYFEPWRRVMYHWLEEKGTLESIAGAICRDGSPCSDNLRQLSHIEGVLGRKVSEEGHDAMLTRAQTVAEHESNKLSERLEIAYAFGEIDEPQRELLQGLLMANKESMFESEEFGLWGQLIVAIKKQIADMSANQGRQLSARLERCEGTLRANEACELLAQARIQLTEARNFAVVEEYLNRFEAGERKLPEGYSEEDSFSEFISDSVYNPLLEACQRGRGQQFTRFARSYVQAHYPSNWSNRHRESSERLISNWPCSGKKKPDPSSLAILFRYLGMSVKGAWQSDIGREHYLLEIRKDRKNRPDYPHPIAMFGTQARSPLDVIVLHGNQSAREIINQVGNARVNGMSVVIVDGCLTLQTRRQVAEIFHTSKSKISPFLMLDQVLALYLALHEETERLPILLKCTLPFTYYQPFIRDGGATADEMFSGRDSELRDIINPQGATVVYGGRQLGKTALLERAESLQNDPDNGRFAVLVNIQQCTSEEEFVKEVVKTINRKTAISLGECSDIDGLCDEVRKVLDGSDVNWLLLLIDEADCFLDSISGKKYMPIKPLVDLKRERPSEFKFVLAGLHNVVRYKNATDNNGIFGQLGSSLCVKPLKPADALRLMSRPLGYLGFDVKRYPHIETILTNTNYYPGILQFFGYELVDTMTKQYGQYYQASRGNPPYELTQEQLGSIMNSRRLNDSIRDKFLLSLKLDPRYLALARCVALLTYENEGNAATEINGISVSEALDCGHEWDVDVLSGESLGSTEILMDEMVDMGILAKGDGEGDGYRLRMHRFLSIIGSADAILEAFVSEGE